MTKNAVKLRDDVKRNGAGHELNSLSELTGPQRRILTTLGWLEDLIVSDSKSPSVNHKGTFSVTDDDSLLNAAQADSDVLV